MYFIIFSVYLVLFSWLLTRIPFIRKSGLHPRMVVALFLLKVLAGCVYGWIHTFPENYAETSDTWKYYFEGLKETRMLLDTPEKFFSELFLDPYNSGYGRLLSTQDSFWNDLKSNIMLKLVGLFNLLTRNHYYSNVILFNFIFFFGPVAVYRCFQDQFPDASRFLLLTGSFLIPSVLFWSSGIHKEGLLLTAIGLVFFSLSRIIRNKVTPVRIIAVLSGLFLIFILRNNVLFALVPALLLWWLTEKFPSRFSLLYLSINLAGIVLFFSSPYIHPDINLPAYVKTRSDEFRALGGNTAVSTDTLVATPAGFLHQLPNAIDLSVLRPHPGDGGVFYIPFTIEVLLGIFILFLAILFPRNRPEGRALIWASLYFSILLLLLIGYTVNNIGAIIRYRSLVLPFLFLPLVLRINIYRLKTVFQLRSHK